jgi:hypothetical protein
VAKAAEAAGPSVAEPDRLPSHFHRSSGHRSHQRTRRDAGDLRRSTVRRASMALAHRRSSHRRSLCQPSRRRRCNDTTPAGRYKHRRADRGLRSIHPGRLRSCRPRSQHRCCTDTSTGLRQRERPRTRPSRTRHSDPRDGTAQTHTRQYQSRIHRPRTQFHTRKGRRLLLLGSWNWHRGSGCHAGKDQIDTVPAPPQALLVVVAAAAAAAAAAAVVAAAVAAAAAAAAAAHKLRPAVQCNRPQFRGR